MSFQQKEGRRQKEERDCKQSLGRQVARRERHNEHRADDRRDEEDKSEKGLDLHSGILLLGPYD